MTIYKDIARRLTAARQRLGLSQAGLAKICGWSQTRVSGYENTARKLSIDDAVTVSRALNMQPAELIFGDTESVQLAPDELKLLNLYNKLPGAEQERMLILFETRLNEIEQYVAEYLRKSRIV
ncbi:helix-turn-helix domain-containing protein [Mixta intestinalis]|uniref:HTH cro/C1-type domain-containing protein n=1 Tax=Mixta intestinalis TaxID=1615494 RepID=A0A6P1PXL5_9GAMM|nr:helix-turn-helix transcriptional regulator [Mixta intestinalis]QHM71306.1 hypothetical protein C7M51_01592 [Mixta intestinalis]